MRFSLSGYRCKLALPRFDNRALPLLNFPSGGSIIDKDSSFVLPRRKEKVVFVMGATGTGKSKLSIDLAIRFNAEIINSDKMQVYQGLDIVTNKVTEEEQRGVAHHLLGVVPPNADFAASDFRCWASVELESITTRRKLPIIAGGSNSYIEALVDDDDLQFRSKYDCCFIWVDVSMPVLHSFVSDRVDQMVKAGLVEELRDMFDPNADYTRGVLRAIGCPEMDHYLRTESTLDDSERAQLLEAAISQIKENTRELARCQLKKIERLRKLSGWDIHRLDATDVFRIRGTDGAEEAWAEQVLSPAAAIVRKFLYERTEIAAAAAVMITAAGPMATAMAAVGR